MRNTFKKGGIHPEAHKEASRGIELLELPKKAVVPLSQHIGTPARPVVSKGDKVRRGMLIAENSAFVSAGLHAPISGTMAGIVPVALPWGKSTQAIVIEADEEEHRADTESRHEYWASMIPGESDRLPKRYAVRYRKRVSWVLAAQHSPHMSSLMSSRRHARRY